MSGRVTRKIGRRRNSEWWQWVLCSDVPPGECTDVHHEKELARLQAELQLFGPFDGVRVLECECQFILIPLGRAS